ncbi:histidine phosphatase family protein [Bradyrhizobium sp. 200]|uniref:histidine phosphatase family protein n=1 Tax=Bradyrhizobium sp. 200 TaxID=2782665 RepID=UPI001FFFA61A|nr:histidine phosphatase family protein [Bradyrhizobium sp. 200]UPJ48026.1 histidine phosphatase family protein [Bradyrhizobium sp. 200]
MQGETFLWLVRHAVVDCPGGTIHPSDAPADLGDRTHLEAVRRCLPQNALSYASPSQRTLDTARALRFDPISVPEFMEQSFGDWTGRRHDDLAACGGESYTQFWKDAARSRPPGGESFEDQIARVRHGLRKIAPGLATLVVHSGTIRAALCTALDIAPQAALRFVIHPLSITRIDRLRDDWRVVSVNQNVTL